MTAYEIREDHTSYYYPFTVYENGNPTDHHFGSQRGAQSWIDTNQAGSDIDLYLFNEVFGDTLTGTDTIIQPGSEEERRYNSQKAAHEATRASYAPAEAQPSREPEVEKSVVFFDGPYEIGTVITDKHDHHYRTTQKSYWLSEKDVADLEDGWDVFEQIGWHTPAELVEEDSNND